MTEHMTSRRRVLAALRHEEPDRVPYDLASTQVTGITNGAYQKLRAYLGWAKEEPRWVDVVQQLCCPVTTCWTSWPWTHAACIR